ncbi:hypothetical protein AB1Y20_012567 [Prymnesium parvum]|uniref:Uncharacterized protein n=1 Tax=Prymnesium parvum TaxID=97485 RepID=A0AB34II88_PRYPA
MALGSGARREVERTYSVRAPGSRGGGGGNGGKGGGSGGEGRSGGRGGECGEQTEAMALSHPRSTQRQPACLKRAAQSSLPTSIGSPSAQSNACTAPPSTHRHSPSRIASLAPIQRKEGAEEARRSARSDTASASSRRTASCKPSEAQWRCASAQVR